MVSFIILIRNATFPSIINNLIVPTVIFVLCKHYCIPGVVWLPTNAVNKVERFLELVHGFIDGTDPGCPAPSAGVELFCGIPLYPPPGCCKGEPCGKPIGGVIEGWPPIADTACLPIAEVA